MTGDCHVRLCVQKRRVCSAGVSPAMAKARSHIARDGRMTGNQHPEAHRQRYRKGNGELIRP